MSQRETDAQAAPYASRLSAWVRALRPDQWVKNLVVLAPLLFSQQLLDAATLGVALASAALFCAVSSAVYLLNDVSDLERDRLHPRKRLRPIAAGVIAPRAALAGSAVLGAVGLALALRLSVPFAGLLALYLALNLGYSLRLKDVPIIDVIMIAGFFVLRAVAGGVAIAVDVSSWLIVCTFMIMLFLALAKRRSELVVMGESPESRPSARVYSVELLDQLMSVTVATTIVSYCLYTLDPDVARKLGAEHLEATIPFVVYGLFRYLYLVRSGTATENPARAVLTDTPLVLAGTLWAALVIALLYLI